jgi:hypothetical protein
MHICGVLLQFLLRYKYLQLCVQILASVQNWLGHTSHFHMDLNTKPVIPILPLCKMNGHHAELLCVCVAMSPQSSWCCKRLGTQLALIGRSTVCIKVLFFRSVRHTADSAYMRPLPLCRRACFCRCAALRKLLPQSVHRCDRSPYVQEHES